MDAEVDAVEPEHPGWYYVPAGPGDDPSLMGLGGEGGMGLLPPARRRRKPLVLSPAPTDVGMTVDAAEFEALAALAEMPSPRSANAQREAAQREALLDAYASGGGGGGGGYGGYDMHGSKRRVGGSLPPLAPSGRGRKPHHLLGRSLSHSAAMERHPSMRRHGGGGGYGGSADFRRSASLDSLTTAQHMFGRLLGALATRLGRSGSAQLPSVAGGDAFSGGDGGGGMERSASMGSAGSLRLFSNGWSQHKWVSGVNGSTPSILSVPGDLFKSALADSAALHAAAAAGPAAMLDAVAKPPVPLFC